MDGPGVGDTRLDSEGAVKRVIRTVQQALVINTRGYHAFLLVLRFGGRLTAEDQEAINFLKSLFGETFTRDFCILVMTCGDNFERDAEDTGLTFKGWCDRQEGAFQDLLQECSGRIVLFDSVTKDQTRRDAQIDRLLDLVDGLKARGQRYTNENFERAKAAKTSAIAESGRPVVKEEILMETSLILQKLEIIKENFLVEEQIEPLQELLARCEELLKVIQTEEQTGPADLGRLELTLASARNWVYEAVRTHAEVAAERRRMEVADSETRERVNQDMESQRALTTDKSESERMAMEMEFEEITKGIEEGIAREKGKREQSFTVALERMKDSLEGDLRDFTTAYREQKRASMSWLEKLGWYLVVVFTFPIAALFKKGRDWLCGILQTL